MHVVSAIGSHSRKEQTLKTYLKKNFLSNSSQFSVVGDLQNQNKKQFKDPFVPKQVKNYCNNNTDFRYPKLSRDLLVILRESQISQARGFIQIAT